MEGVGVLGGGEVRNVSQSKDNISIQLSGLWAEGGREGGKEEGRGREGEGGGGRGREGEGGEERR